MRSLILCVSVVFVSTFMGGAGCRSLHADIIVEVDSKSFTVGGSGTVDVWVYSNDGDINVSGFDFDFDIIDNPNNVLSLEFDAIQFLTEAEDSDYIFFGAAGPLHFLGDTGFELVGGDLDLGANGFSTVGSDRKLIAQLDLTHLLPDGTLPSLALGDVFTISPNFADDFFVFYDEFGDPDAIGINQTLSSGGTITMSAAVPEPGTFASSCPFCAA